MEPSVIRIEIQQSQERTNTPQKQAPPFPPPSSRPQTTTPTNPSVPPAAAPAPPSQDPSPSDPTRPIPISPIKQQDTAIQTDAAIQADAAIQTDENYVTHTELTAALKKSHHLIESLKLENFRLKIDKFELERADKRSKYKRAEKIYKDLISDASTLPLSTNTEYESALRGLKYAYAEMQIGRKKFGDAEMVAREVLEGRNETDVEGIKMSRRQLATALWQGGKHKEAEIMFHTVWTLKPPNVNEDLWTLENGDSLCEVLSEQGEYDHACTLQRDVWEARGKVQGKTHKDTLGSASALVEIVKYQIGAAKEEFGKKACEVKLKEVLSEVWGLWKPELAIENSKGLWNFGAMLGKIHYDDKENEMAMSVLLRVWEGLKSQPGEVSESTMNIADQLADACFNVKNYPTAEEVSNWAWQQRKSKLGVKHSKTLETRFDIGRAVFERGERYGEAEIIFKEVYQARKTSKVLGPKHKDTLECGHYLTEAISKQPGRSAEAMRNAKDIFYLKKDVFPSKNIELPKSAFLYGTLLFDLATGKEAYQRMNDDPPNLYRAVEEAFVVVWEARDQKAGLAATKIVRAGQCLGTSLIKIGKRTEARDVLYSLWDRPQEDLELQNLDLGYKLAKAYMAVDEHKTAVNILKDVWDKRNFIEKGAENAEYKYAYALGECWLKRGEYENAIDILENGPFRKGDGGMKLLDRARRKLKKCRRREAQVK